MTLDLNCPNCKEMIRKPVIEPSTDVKIPNATLYRAGGWDLERAPRR
jgi:hypothetical protein